jgi:hypothetical protein
VIRAVIAASACLAAACSSPPAPRMPVWAPPCPDRRPPDVRPAYRAPAALSGPAPILPSVVIPSRAERDGDAFTVWGARHLLKSRHRSKEVTSGPITIVGWIVATNYASAPRCAVHPAGQADPPDCVAPLPAFFIADARDDKDVRISVLGWVSNWAQLYMMIQAIEKAPPGERASYTDVFFGQEVPNPVPDVGARVRVTGHYGFTFARSTGSGAADPQNGIFTLDRIEYLAEPPRPATLPGMPARK